ncbi:MAG: T9SS type A sorting domain-containing protein [Balneolales bacterium]|nr:T9SS type A sorting domain-containing protein [Balneolales bacterium]
MTFDGSRLSSGVYIYRLTANGQTLTQKMTLVK